MACLEQDCWIRLNTNAPWNDTGEGLFSTREIEMGHLIYTEFPETIVNHLDPKYRENAGDGIDLLYFCRSSLTREKYDEELKYTLLGKNIADMLVKKRKGGIFDWTTELEMLSVKPTWVNHSCVPNMYRIDSNDLITGRLKCQFFALRDISEGEELTIAYENVVAWESVSTRRAFLGREYGFFCRCPRCAEEAELRDMEPLRRKYPNNKDPTLKYMLICITDSGPHEFVTTNPQRQQTDGWCWRSRHFPVCEDSGLQAPQNLF